MDKKQRKRLRVALFVVWAVAAAWSVYGLSQNPHMPAMLFGFAMMFAAVAASWLVTVIAVYLAGGFRRPPR